MDDDQLLRYSRHISLAEIEITGQERILAAKVLIIGAGGLGSPAATYLAGAGVGHITICDGDTVELSNLQRQTLHHADRIGENKAISAAAALAQVNPGCAVTPVTTHVDAKMLDELVPAADVVIEASDNLPTRHAVNRACVKHGRPLVSGAAIRFAGQLGVFDPRQKTSPCYACFVPEDTQMPEERCVTLGVFAPLTGIIGTMQAAEALHLIISGESGATGRLLLFDAMAADWQAMDLPRNPTCPVCNTSDADAA